jgi:hypothetical protein
VDGGAVSARRLAALALGVGVALSTTVALAQEPAPPPGAPPVAGNFGGGTIVDPPKFAYGAGNMIISLRVTGNGKVQVLANMAASCGRATYRATAPLAADGSFATTGYATLRTPGVRIRSKYVIDGTMSAASASGSATIHSRSKLRGGHTRTCKTGAVPWAAKVASGTVGTPAAAPAAARLYGTTSQRIGGPQFAIVLRVSADGTRLTRTLFGVNSRCGGRSEKGLDSTHERLKIGADGRVSDVERGTYKLNRSTRVRYVEHFGATVGSQGAIGTFNDRARFIDIPSGKTFRRCHSGTVRWQATL